MGTVQSWEILGSWGVGDGSRESKSNKVTDKERKLDTSEVFNDNQIDIQQEE